MPTPFEYLQSLNRLVHEPARLAILVALFRLRQGGLLVPPEHHRADEGQPVQPPLEARRSPGLVEIEKTFEGKTPVTYIKLTLEGKDALKRYWKSLDKARAGIRLLKPIRTT